MDFSRRNCGGNRARECEEKMKTPSAFRIPPGLTPNNAVPITIPEPGWIYSLTTETNNPITLRAHPEVPAPDPDSELIGSASLYLDQPGTWYVRTNFASTTAIVRYYPNSAFGSGGDVPPSPVMNTPVPLHGTRADLLAIRNQAVPASEINTLPSSSLGKIIVTSNIFYPVTRSSSWLTGLGTDRRALSTGGSIRSLLVNPTGRYARKSRDGRTRLVAAPYEASPLPGTTAYGDSAVLHVNIPSGTFVSVDRIQVSIVSTGTNPPILTCVYTTAARPPNSGVSISPVSPAPADDLSTTSTWYRSAALPTATEFIFEQVALENKVGERFVRDFEDGILLQGPASISIKVWTNGGVTAPQVFAGLILEEWT